MNIEDFFDKYHSWKPIDKFDKSAKKFDYYDMIGFATEWERVTKEVISGETSDGYHTFNELYDFRKTYNALLFNQWADLGLYDVHKAKKHYDGEDCFGGGWFVVFAMLPTGQITNHYELSDWDIFDIPEEPKVKIEFDGHTPQDVLKRMKDLV